LADRLEHLFCSEACFREGCVALVKLSKELARRSGDPFERLDVDAGLLQHFGYEVENLEPMERSHH
jgi:hypothetical protein